MSRLLRHVLLAAMVMLAPALGSAQSASMRALKEAVRAARDADLKADWDGLVEARARVSAWGATADLPGMADYYLGYIDWRMSSLAYLVTGPPGMIPLLDRAIQHLRSSVAAKPTFAEAHALLATCAGVLGGSDRSRLEELVPILKTEWPPALEHGARNPRVQLLRAMTEVFAPPQYGGDRARGLERWKEAIRLFEQEQQETTSSAPAAWGHAEAWAWLGGAYLMTGRPDEARTALEEAVRLRPDFWWAARAALPQARRPVTR